MSVANLCREMTKINIYSFLRKREAWNGKSRDTGNIGTQDEENNSRDTGNIGTQDEENKLQRYW